MKTKNKILIALVAVLLVAVIAVGLMIPRAPTEEVLVYPVSMVGYTDYYSTGSESYGVVTTDKVQTIYVSETQTVTEIMVYQGQQVKKGDVLYTYDTTLSDLAVERKDLSIQQMEINLTNAKAELKKLKAMKPMVITQTNTKPSQSTGKYDKSPSDYLKLNTAYGGSGTAKDPLRVWLSQNAAVDDAMIAGLMGNRTHVYVVFQLTEHDKTNSQFVEQYGVRYTVSEVVPTDPTDPGEPSVPTDPSDPTDPSGSEPTETDPTEPSATEPAETDPPTTGAAQTQQETEAAEGSSGTVPAEAPRTRAAARSVTRYVMTFFDPEEEQEEATPNTQVDWNSGYTQAELVAMRNEKSAEIKELEFNIKMGKAELKIMEKEAADGKVVAEFDGVVASVLEPANAVELDMPMMKITGGGGFYVEGSVSELELDTIQLGQTVIVTCWDNGMTYEGVVAEVGSYPSEENNYYSSGAGNVTYYPYRVFIEESADLMDGAYVGLTYQAATQSGGVLNLQNAFIRTEGGESFVYVRNAEGMLEKRVIRVGASLDGYMTPVYAGLTEEDFIAFPYGNTIQEGAPTLEGTADDLYGY